MALFTVKVVVDPEHILFGIAFIVGEKLTLRIRLFKASAMYKLQEVISKVTPNGACNSAATDAPHHHYILIYHFRQ